MRLGKSKLQCILKYVILARRECTSRGSLIPTLRAANAKGRAARETSYARLRFTF